MSFSSPFSSSLKVLSKSGELVSLELDLSKLPTLLDIDGVPVAKLDLSDGGGANVRFDSDPPKFSRLETGMNGFKVSKSEFVSLMKTSRATE